MSNVCVHFRSFRGIVRQVVSKHKFQPKFRHSESEPRKNVFQNVFAQVDVLYSRLTPIQINSFQIQLFADRVFVSDDQRYGKYDKLDELISYTAYSQKIQSGYIE